MLNIITGSVSAQVRVYAFIIIAQDFITIDIAFILLHGNTIGSSSTTAEVINHGIGNCFSLIIFEDRFSYISAGAIHSAFGVKFFFSKVNNDEVCFEVKFSVFYSRISI